MAAERIDRKEYPSFGECIYCGAKAGQVELTDEHIVPFSLGGNAVILDGSCRACAPETTKIENEVGRKLLWDFRKHAQVQTRRPKERPKELPFTYSIADGERQTKTVPVDDHPYFTPMPVWGLPGVLQAKQPSTQFEHYKAHVSYWIPPNILETLGLEDGVPAYIPLPEFRINHEYVARAIAKIAYCQAVVTHGFRSTFRDWAAEVTNYPNELAEMALAHAIDDEAEAAYRRGDLFEKRRAMMEDWAAFCGRAGRPENVVPIRAA